jgi:Outer membrane protein beta-barrel domain
VARKHDGGTIMTTRTLVVTACLVALWPVGAAAQQIGGGVKGGLSLGDVPKIADEIYAGGDTALRTGYAVGGFLAIRFDNGFSVQPEVLFTQKGVKLTFSDSSMSEDLRYKSDYVDVPVLARYTFGKGIRGYVFAGPSFDFMLNTKVKTQLFGESGEQDVSEDVESFEFALVFGGGVELGPLLLEARWSEGLTNLAADTTEINIKTRTFLFLGGFRF